MSRKKVLVGVLVVIGLVVLVVAASLGGSATSSADMDFSDVVTAAQAGHVQQIKSGSHELTVYLRGEAKPHPSTIGSSTDVVQALETAGVKVGTGDGPRVTYSKTSAYDSWLGIGISYSPTVVYLVILYFTLRNATREGFRRALAMSSGTPQS